MFKLKRPKLRLTIGGLLILTALIALGLYWTLPAITRITDVKVGTGPAVKKGDTVTVHYVGKLRDGTEFDSSKKGGQPIDFPVGQGMLIRGMDTGIVGMRPGGVRRLEIPASQAYGEKGIPGTIPPNATLGFEVELIGIR
ncbi:MAG: FKBP-type peptidyl-prolyl cis-trans isomerase [Isosphaeraceae bacterium]